MDDEANPGTYAYELKLQHARQTWSDGAILAELTALPVLADDAETTEDYPDWHNLSLLKALAELAAERKLVAAVTLVLERACFGDPGETMRGLRHPLEEIVNPDWDVLLEICLKTAQSVNKGARLWSIRELGILRDKKALPFLIQALSDTENRIVQQTALSLIMVCQKNPECRAAAIEAIETAVKQHHDAATVRSLQEDADEIQGMEVI